VDTTDLHEHLQSFRSFKKTEIFLLLRPQTLKLLKPSDLAGYRNSQVYIKGSMHTPLNSEAVHDAIPALFELLLNEEDAGVRAVLGHFIFVYIHPLPGP
jgi:Fic family protein